MKTILIKTQYITLGQFLKYTGIVGQGSDTKQYLLLNNIFVNDIKDQRRGRKLYPNDIIKIDKNLFEVKKDDS